MQELHWLRRGYTCGPSQARRVWRETGCCPGGAYGRSDVRVSQEAGRGNNPDSQVPAVEIELIA